MSTKAVIKRMLAIILRWPVLCVARVLALGLRFAHAEELYPIFSRCGYHLLPFHYYLPIPDPDERDAIVRAPESKLVGLDLNESGALELTAQLEPYFAEFRAHYPLHPTPGQRFHLVNGAFMAGDAHMYYALIRKLKPRRIIEIGSGYSTLIACDAVLANARETNSAASVVAIEPFPPPHLNPIPAGLTKLDRRRLQDVPLEAFAELAAGDILFIDSSHVLRPGNDVQREYCEILPRLAPGVHIHVHDVSLPGHYPDVYFDKRLFWTEQYVLQAFLAFNSRFEVLWPGSCLAMRHPDRISAFFPDVAAMRATYPLASPSSFWMRVRS